MHAVQDSEYELNVAGYFEELQGQLERQRKQLERLARRSHIAMTSQGVDQHASDAAASVPSSFLHGVDVHGHVPDGLLSGARLLGEDGAPSPVPSGPRRRRRLHDASVVGTATAASSAPARSLVPSHAATTRAARAPSAMDEVPAPAPPSATLNANRLRQDKRCVQRSHPTSLAQHRQTQAPSRLARMPAALARSHATFATMKARITKEAAAAYIG